ncbi:hypothetical protein RHSIM_Rhsim07G0137400 [Rhododendron simsii]|uniref:Uncharacterized protein n=1 Tax=Rhododendron simsii TaxID=118357 RepID=A0A834GLF6_RHOSS|nr:hypothetical protein RHSIM_Rhsim07G0137400 [Rhododendron simsii]
MIDGNSIFLSGRTCSRCDRSYVAGDKVGMLRPCEHFLQRGCCSRRYNFPTVFHNCLTKIIIKMAAAKGVRRIWVGQNGLLSTPAASVVVHERVRHDGNLIDGDQHYHFGISDMRNCWGFIVIYFSTMLNLSIESNTNFFLPMPEGALCLIAATAFCAEYLLFYFHSTSHKGLEGYYHLLLVLLIVSVAGALFPTSFPVDLCCGIAVTLQGLWFYQTAFTFYGSMMPEGCQLKNIEISCHSADSELLDLGILILGACTRLRIGLIT